MDAAETTVDEEMVPNGADVEAVADGEEAARTDEAPARSEGLAGIVTGSYWSSFFLVLIGANTVGDLHHFAERSSVGFSLAYNASIAGVHGPVSSMSRRWGVRQCRRGA